MSLVDRTWEIIEWMNEWAWKVYGKFSYVIIDSALVSANVDAFDGNYSRKWRRQSAISVCAEVLEDVVRCDTLSNNVASCSEREIVLNRKSIVGGVSRLGLWRYLTDMAKDPCIGILYWKTAAFWWDVNFRLRFVFLLKPNALSQNSDTRLSRLSSWSSTPGKYSPFNSHPSTNYQSKRV